jgi:hypothetical protein
VFTLSGVGVEGCKIKEDNIGLKSSSRVKKSTFISLRREESQPGLEKTGTVRFRL